MHHAGGDPNDPQKRQMTPEDLRGTQHSHREDRRHSSRAASHTIRVGNRIDQAAREDGNGQVCRRWDRIAAMVAATMPGCRHHSLAV